MSQSMRELRESSRLTRMGRRLSLMLSKESIFGTINPKGIGILSDSAEVTPGSSPSPSPLPQRRNTVEGVSPPPCNPECRVYGVELQTAVSRSNTLHRDLPEVIYKCFVYLDEKGLDEEGIFRMSGSATDILKIKGQFNQGVAYDLSTCLNPHTVSGLLKLFLRELPQPLFPTEIDTSETDLLGRLKIMIEGLPRENKCLMGCLFSLLYKVSKAESVTKMGIQNLVIVFSATLNCSGTILTKLIKHARDIFPDNLLTNTGIPEQHALQQQPQPQQSPTQQPQTQQPQTQQSPTQQPSTPQPPTQQPLTQQPPTQQPPTQQLPTQQLPTQQLPAQQPPTQQPPTQQPPAQQPIQQQQQPQQTQPQQQPQQTQSGGARVVVDLSSKSISKADSRADSNKSISKADSSSKQPIAVVVAVDEDEDIFVVDDDKKKKKPESSPVTTPNKERKLKKSADLKVKPIETTRRRDLRRQLTKTIFDSDDSDDDANNNDLLVPASKSLPARARGFFLR